jgi:hypothetical protein
MKKAAQAVGELMDWSVYISRSKRQWIGSAEARDRSH